MNSSATRCLQATEAQLVALIDYMEEDPLLARGHLKTACAKRKINQFWERVTPRINSLGGATKSKTQWMKYWSDKKSAIKKKAVERAAARQRTGGGVENVREITQTEERVLVLLGGEGFAVGDRHLRYDLIQETKACNPPFSSISLHEEPIMEIENNLSILIEPAVALLPSTSGQKPVVIAYPPIFKPPSIGLDHDNANSDGKAMPRTSSQNVKQHSPSSGNEVKVFCPKCNTQVPHTAEGMQQDQTKILIANVYHYFEHEYEELKKMYGDLDLTPLSKFGQRTALATGVSETTVLQILKEEEERNANKLQELPEKPRSARKRSRQTDSVSEEDSSDDNVDDNEQASNVHEVQTLVVKVESPDYYNEEPEIYVPLAVKVDPSDIEHDKELAQTDPIGVDVKTEPRSDVLDNTNETLALNEPAGTKRRARKIPRSDVTATRQHTRGDSSTAAAASSVRLTEELDESSLFGDTEIKVEDIEIHEEGAR